MHNLINNIKFCKSFGGLGEIYKLSIQDKSIQRGYQNEETKGN